MKSQSNHHDIERLKNEFVSLVSHELRTPLTSIKGSLGLILGGACGELNNDLRDLLTIAYSNSDRLIKLINEILDLSKIEAGQVPLKTAPTDLTEVVEQSVMEIGGFAQQRGVLIVTSLEPDLPLVQADADQIQRVLMNLLSNALKFSPADDQVVISSEYRDGWVTIRVKDHGMGIPPEYHDRIFNKFQQVQSVVTRKLGGTGLGLAICKAIIDQHGGRIGVESEPGAGSCFYFSLPIAPPTATREPRAPAHPITPAPPTETQPPTGIRGGNRPRNSFVLMVDDDPGLRMVVSRIVQHSGHQVETANNGEEAIEKVKKLHPDLIILDILMPVLSGFGVVQTLRRHPDTRHLPLLVLTTKDLNDAEKEALRLGPTKFLTKSLVTVETLTLAMNELLQHRLAEVTA
ncbi:MAG: hybrid sensor histidine kinase/response regulator [Acidobacteriota bacterium]|nr:hybrid sensor histidine kinase/response regulator [Blastocatellia bacterium]MDW8238965.1 hybrid sensor histidine kinase/response regulator [Acidobacteriota bacterium]